MYSDVKTFGSASSTARKWVRPYRYNSAGDAEFAIVSFVLVGPIAGVEFRLHRRPTGRAGRRMPGVKFSWRIGRLIRGDTGELPWADEPCHQASLLHAEPFRAGFRSASMIDG